MRCTSIRGVLGKFDRLLRRLTSRSGDYEPILEAILIEGVSREFDSMLSFIMREELRFTITTLHKNAGDTSLQSEFTQLAI